MNFARPRTVQRQLDQVLSSLAEINRMLVQLLANETQHSAVHSRLEARLDHVEQEIESLRQVNS